MSEESSVGFEDFVRETREVLLRHAWYQGSDLHSAQDAVQVVYLKMFQAWEKLSSKPGSLVGYGKKAVANAVIDQYRRNGNGRAMAVPAEEIPERTSDIGIPDAAYQTVRKGIDELVAGLPHRQREVVTLCILKDMSPAESGVLLGLKEDSVKRYIRAALKNLQKAVSKSSEEVTA